ncbi:hypothetical protein E2C01_030494 [Portunus trituberculatus]|uniref:Uncharacterized protein n=1 Tax=Portunus trituberculatus TaxID=210409 RepID=A0A5B7ES69_PORTR|nr:hypothetical protein [Portunus trituberculatus]
MLISASRDKSRRVVVVWGVMRGGRWAWVVSLAVVLLVGVESAHGAITLAYDTRNKEHPLQIAGTCPGLAEQSWDGFISITVLCMLSQ